MIDSTGNAKRTWRDLIKLEVNLGQLIIVAPILGALVTGIWQASAIRTTYDDNARLEAATRAAETKALHDQVNALNETLKDVRQDVRELRSYVVVDARYGKGAQR